MGSRHQRSGSIDLERESVRRDYHQSFVQAGLSTEQNKEALSGDIRFTLNTKILTRAFQTFGIINSANITLTLTLPNGLGNYFPGCTAITEM